MDTCICDSGWALLIRSARFRWAGCQLDILAQCTTKGKVRRALKELPKTLYETYDRIVRTIADGVHSQEAVKLLTWLAYAARPLEIGELLEVTGIFLDDESRFDRDEVLTDPYDVLRICSSLVSIATIIDGEPIEYSDPKERSIESSYARDVDCGIQNANDLGVERSGHSGHNEHATYSEYSTGAGHVPELGSTAWRRQHVRLAHFSVREYLASDRPCVPQYRLRIIGSHDMLASSCLVCLLQNYSMQYYDVSTKVRSRGARLFRYAADCWAIHAKASGEFSELQNELVHELLVMDFSALEATIETIYTSRGRCYYQTALQPAVGEGYEAIAQMLRDKRKSCQS